MSGNQDTNTNDEVVSHASLEPPVDGTTVTPKKKLSRDEMREVFSNVKPVRKPLTFHGVDVEIVPPSLDFLMEQQDRGLSKKQMTIEAIINYVYVPGTNEHVFEEADADMIGAMPFDADMIKLTQSITAALGVVPSNDDKSKVQD